MRSKRGQKLFGCNDRRLHRKHLFDQAAMDFGVTVRAAILQNDATIVGISGMSKRGQDHAAGGDSEQRERTDVLRAKDHIQVGAGKGAHAVLDDRDVSVLRGNCWMHLGTGRMGRKTPVSLIPANLEFRGLTSG